MSETRMTFREYAEHLREVRKRTDLSDKAKLVYESLLDFAGSDDSCYPGQRTVALSLGNCQAKTVCAAVANLKSVGLVSIEKWTDERGRERNLYRFPQRSRQGNVVTNGTWSSGDGERSHTGNGNVVPATTDRTHIPYPLTETQLFNLGQQHKSTRRATSKDAEQIYQAYPRKEAKAAALKAIEKAIKTIATRPNVPDPAAFLIERVQAYAAAKQGSDPKFIPHPATWFNDGRYDDDPENWKPAPKSSRPQYGNGHHRQPPRANPKTSENIATRIL